MTLSSVQLICLSILLGVIAVAVVARRIGISYPILLVLAGLGVSLIPHVPPVPLPHEVVFLVFLPPLLYAGAWTTDWRTFKRYSLSIAMLATGLVGFTVLGIAWLAPHFIHALDFRSALLLGAVVAATDAVAAGSIARTLGIAPRIIGILEGESLVNDATALLALEFALSLFGEGPSLTFGTATLRLVWLIAGGVGAGLLLGFVMTFVERWVNDGPLEMAISLAVPYIAYLGAERMHASGVLAVVACGLFLSRQSAQLFSAPARIELTSAWAALDFVLNGFIFVLMGLQLPTILAGIRDYRFSTLLAYGAAISVILVALRLAWVFPAARVSYALRTHLFHQQDAPPEPRATFLVGWVGMRGVVSLAAAYSIPDTMSGMNNTQRPLILFLTFCVIFCTLVVQGISLPAIIRALGLGGNRELKQEEFAVRCDVLNTAIHHLKTAGKPSNSDEQHDIDDVLHHYEHRLEALRAARAKHSAEPAHAVPAAIAARQERRTELVREIMQVERDRLLAIREAGEAGDEVIRIVERELDLTETRAEHLF